ncbi:DUF3054 domain-containing protein [Rothia nasimurium]|uniref:DUF3054 domain-containing protein n=1 Tax=Rothia nasimurium TaxID=85336 RepID=UPI003B9E7D99
MSANTMSRLSQPVRLTIDLVLVLVFIALGLLSHQESLQRLLVVALPFILALGASHLGVWAVASRRVLPLGLEGIMVWVTTLVLGLGLRLSFGETAAVAFAVVSALVLLVFLVGWRLAFMLFGRMKARARI